MHPSPARLTGWLLGAAALLVPFSALHAQWQTSGSDIYYNAGRVGIGQMPASFSTVAVTGSDGVSLQVYNLAAGDAIRGQTVGGWAVTGLDFGTTPDSAGFYGIGVAGQTQLLLGISFRDSDRIRGLAVERRARGSRPFLWSASAQDLPPGSGRPAERPMVHGREVNCTLESASRPGRGNCLRRQLLPAAPPLDA